MPSSPRPPQNRLIDACAAHVAAEPAPAAQWPAASPADDAWRLQALCAETDPEAFFPGKGESSREAKRVCGECAVRAECLLYALTHDVGFGIWGGLSEKERRRLRRGRQLPLSA